VRRTEGKIMKAIFAALGVLLLAAAALGVRDLPAQAQAMPAMSAASCAKLAELNAPDVTINAAAIVHAGPFTAPGEPKPANLPAFCRVQGVATPTADSHIEFEVWIPRDTWNGKFQAVGVGGYSGSISYGAMVDA